MGKFVRFIHIKSLSKESIFDVYCNLSKYKFYSLETETTSINTDENFWGKIKKYCYEEIEDIFGNPINEPQDYINFILINTSRENGQPFDYFCIQYFLAFLFQLKNKYLVCFYQNEDDSKAKNYFRLSNFLNLWIAQANQKSSFLFFNLCADVCVDISKSINFNPKKLAYSFNYDTASETVLPIISINKKMYQTLDQPYNPNRDPESLNKLLNSIKTKNSISLYYRYYTEYIYHVINKILSETESIWDEQEKALFNTNPPLIVIYIYSIIKSHIQKKDFSKLTFPSLIEKCFDYSQGLMQLLENSIKHVVDKNVNSCAYFYIRMHHQIGCMNNYVINPHFKKIKYYLEMSIIDCVDNSLDAGIVCQYNHTLRNFGISEINNLSEIFEYPFKHSQPLKQYYSSVSNIANHYGLQIFDTILTSNNGLFIVQSGKQYYPDIYTNSNKIKYESELVYKTINHEELQTMHFAGTNYTIILPIDINSEETISSHLSLGNTPLQLFDGLEETTSKTLIPIKLKGGSKEEAVKQYIEKIRELFLLDQNKIIALNVNKISQSRIHLELLCKAVITIISNQEENRKVICLLDICDEYRLLDVTRIMTLFYDKTGQCTFLDNKGIYLACKNGQYDILFTGNSISSIVENIERQRLVQSLPETFYKHITAVINDRINDEV